MGMPEIKGFDQRHRQPAPGQLPRSACPHQSGTDDGDVHPLRRHGSPLEPGMRRPVIRRGGRESSWMLNLLVETMVDQYGTGRRACPLEPQNGQEGRVT